MAGRWQDQFESLPALSLEYRWGSCASSRDLLPISTPLDPTGTNDREACLERHRLQHAEPVPYGVKHAEPVTHGVKEATAGTADRDHAEDALRLDREERCMLEDTCRALGRPDALAQRLLATVVRAGVEGIPRADLPDRVRNFRPDPSEVSGGALPGGPAKKKRKAGKGDAAPSPELVTESALAEALECCKPPPNPQP